MIRTRRRLPSHVAVLLMLASLGTSTVAGQKPPKATAYPTVAEFADRCDDLARDCGIRADGWGPYYDGLDGVSSVRVAGSTTTNGWAWDLKARRSTTLRTLTYDLTNPLNAPAQGVITVNDTHGQIYDLSDMAVGEVRSVRASFHLFVARVEYVLRFGQTQGDGSSPLEVTRTSSDAFHVRTVGQDDLARFLRGNGPGEVLIGIYHVPVELSLTNQ